MIALGRAAPLRGLVLIDGEIGVATGHGVILHSHVLALPGVWHAVAATFDGAVVEVFVDGIAVAAASNVAAPDVSGPASAIAQSLEFAPVNDLGSHFGGSLALLTVWCGALPAERIRSLGGTRPDFSLIAFKQVGAVWPLQEHAWRGLQEPQEAWTLPRGRAAPEVPGHAVPGNTRAQGGALTLGAQGSARIDAWELAAAPSIEAGGAQLSQPRYRDRAGPGEHWYEAVVPGTVLTTLIARGLYPDPDYGLNNMLIPESLSHQDYWYRSEFIAPASLQGHTLTLRFNGINYAAEVWLNGRRLGEVHGAFVRGSFDVTGVLTPGGANALAVRISPPPHPGIPHEQSVAAGPGNNGGAMALDGPTFIASEGWDWIPGIRDRNSGIWQSVELLATGRLRLGDLQVVTHLPLPRTDSAEITLAVPVENGGAVMRGTVTARIDGITIKKTLDLQPGSNLVRLSPVEFPQLHLVSPRLWWPNGYGAASLYSLQIELGDERTVSDSKSLRFGIRELTYELSLFDHDGRLRRVEVDPTVGTARGERLVDTRHEAIKRTPRGWAQSLTRAGETSPAVCTVPTESLTPYLVIRVNGVPIAARGGSWGMDDSRKRISRDRLEPYFKLERDAHLNIIRNWLGQNTEEVFYDLADEYGFLVLNDFWVSTQEFQLEPQDSALFLANARDVISRYRNHPSIAVWFGRNEGVPPPVVNEGLADLLATLDGTRLYTGSSNEVNLQGSGPYNYRPPEQYFTNLARGFSVEVGTPSLSTLESLQASIPADDRWPLNDTYAYHDWHFGGNGDVATFMAAMAAQYGAGASLEDFERKAQLMDYVSYRAIFEGFNAHLWTQNSGRLLWMTHPAWPSNTWQIYSSDYDTAAAYYAVKKACEPVHVQLDLPDFALTVVNTTRADRNGLELRTRVLSLAGRLLEQRTDRVDARANAAATLPKALDLRRYLGREGVVLVKLSLLDAASRIVSENVYWPGLNEAAQQALNRLAPQPVSLAARYDAAGVDVMLRNAGDAPVLNAKITMFGAAGERVLPVEYDDNYVTLMPGESRHLGVRCGSQSVKCTRVKLRGWNVLQTEADIAPATRR